MSPRYCWLTGSGCIEVGGADATDFLNGQLSQAMDRVGEGRAPLAAWNDPRGRARVIFRIARLADRWLLATSADLLDPTVKRLGAFVLRAKVTLASAPERLSIALLDMDPAWLAARGLSASAARDAAATHGHSQLVHVGGGLWHGMGPRLELEALTRGLDVCTRAEATLEEIRLGLPALTRATAERYVAQMLNLDLLGALAFDKGCYPGQEVIARVHNLGSVKRRMRRFASESHAVPDAGAELLDAEGQAVGEVLRAAPAEHGAEMLAVVDHAAADLPLLTPNNAHWHQEPLPYDIPSR